MKKKAQQTNKWYSFFDRIVVINLKRRPERLVTFRANLKEHNWCFREPEVFVGIDGNKVPTPYGFQQGGGAWGCVLPGTYAQGKIEKALQSFYSGPCVEIITAFGHRLPLTVNHPVLTENGFIPAGSIKQGDNVISYRCDALSSKPHSAVNYPQYAPAKIEEIFQSSLRQGALRRRKLATNLDLYGDGEFIQGNINVVNVDSSLLLEGDAELSQSTSNYPFRRRDVQQVSFSPNGTSSPSSLNVSRPLFSALHSLPFDITTNGNTSVKQNTVQARRIAASSVRRSFIQPEFSGKLSQTITSTIPVDNYGFGSGVKLLGSGKQCCIGPASQLDVTLSEPAGKSIASDSDLTSQLFKRFPGSISVDQVVQVRRFNYHGHVYDLQTSTGYFVINAQNYYSTSGVIIANCLQGHRQILERAILDDVDKLLVFEDDAFFKSGGVEQLCKFLEDVPDDWDQLMIGGQHTKSPKQVKPGVVQCMQTDRTHCYAIRGQFMRDLYATWCAPGVKVHCDWILRTLHSSRRVYAPDPFILGQESGPSDISGRVNPRSTWNAPPEDLPVILLNAPMAVVKELRNSHGLHTGYDRDATSDIDKGLITAFKQKNPQPFLSNWIRTIQWEAFSDEGLICTVWHPQATVALVKQCTRGEVIEITANTVGEALAKLPDQKPRANYSATHCVLLKAPRKVAADLRAIGWHSGNWRDSVTDIDNGLRQIFEGSNKDVTAQLQKWFDVLGKEVAEMRNGLLCLWHPLATVEAVSKATDRVIVEITAESAEEALKQWKEKTNDREAISEAGKSENPI